MTEPRNKEIYSMIRESLGLPASTNFRGTHGKNLDFKRLKCQAKIPTSRNFLRLKYQSRETDRTLCVFVCLESVEGSECLKHFRKWHNLFDHIRTHTNERPFLCPVAGCTDAFKQYSN